MKKRLIELLLCLSACLSVIAPTAHAASDYAPKNSDMAIALYQLGLFKGKSVYCNGDPDFALKDMSTRAEGLVMLIRLLGEENEALAYEGDCPFTDVPNWAYRYVSYAYGKGYTKGISYNLFAPDETLQSLEYMTFLLRALGYSEAAGDFDFQHADKLFRTLVEASDYYAGSGLSRGVCVEFSYRALNVKLKNSDLTLVEKLILDGTLTEQAVQESGIFSGDGTFFDTVPTQLWTEDQSIFYLLTSLPNYTYAYHYLKEFKTTLAQIDEMGGSAYYPDKYEDIDLNYEYTNYSEFENHTNAEVRQFIEDYVRNFDPSYLFADKFPDAPPDFRHDIEIWYSLDYEKSSDCIELGRAHWKENLNVLRFCAIIDEAPGNYRYLMRSWQMGTLSSASLKNILDKWIAVGGIYKNFKIISQ